MEHFESIVIHHSASPRRSTTAEDIRSWHVDDNGWDDIGYHFVIEADGSVVIGRRLPKTGAHAPPNSGRIGICITGNNTTPNSRWNMRQIYSLVSLVRHLLAVFPWIKDGEKLFRHSELNDTKCPGLREEEWTSLYRACMDTEVLG